MAAAAKRAAEEAQKAKALEAATRKAAAAAAKAARDALGSPAEGAPATLLPLPLSMPHRVALARLCSSLLGDVAFANPALSEKGKAAALSLLHPRVDVVAAVDTPAAREVQRLVAEGIVTPPSLYGVLALTVLLSLATPMPVGGQAWEALITTEALQAALHTLDFPWSTGRLGQEFAVLHGEGAPPLDERVWLFATLDQWVRALLKLLNITPALQPEEVDLSASEADDEQHRGDPSQHSPEERDRATLANLYRTSHDHLGGGAGSGSPSPRRQDKRPRFEARGSSSGEPEGHWRQQWPSGTFGDSFPTSSSRPPEPKATVSPAPYNSLFRAHAPESGLQAALYDEHSQCVDPQALHPLLAVCFDSLRHMAFSMDKRLAQF